MQQGPSGQWPRGPRSLSGRTQKMILLRLNDKRTSETVILWGRRRPRILVKGLRQPQPQFQFQQYRCLLLNPNKTKPSETLSSKVTFKLRGQKKSTEGLRCGFSNYSRIWILHTRIKGGTCSISAVGGRLFEKYPSWKCFRWLQHAKSTAADFLKCFQGNFYMYGLHQL